MTYKKELQKTKAEFDERFGELIKQVRQETIDSVVEMLGGMKYRYYASNETGFGARVYNKAISEAIEKIKSLTKTK